MHSIIIFASGRGSNAAAIIDYFKKTNTAKVALIVTNKADAGVIQLANKEEVPYLIISKKTLQETMLIEQLSDYKPSLIVLAGFLLKIPDAMVNVYPNRIINIHPALLPAHGGKGMYGANVHEAVLKSKATESGITIHYVNNHYDEGNIILQARCPVKTNDTAEILAKRVLQLEHYYYPRAIDFLLQSL